MSSGLLIGWMPASILFGFVAAFLAPWLSKGRGVSGGIILSSVPLLLFCYFISFVSRVAEGESFSVGWDWIPELGLRFSLLLDGLSLLLALLISGIGILIFIYSGGYIKEHPRRGRFHAYLLLFMASMLGLVLSDNLLLLFLFWELTTLTSFLLIGFKHDQESARKSALQALLVTALGGILLLAGFLMLGNVAGDFDISRLGERQDELQSHGLYLPIFLLIFLGAASKSALFPFHFWLPNAMEAPTPVSAYLHSATMVKAGVYLLARLHPLFGGTGAWELALIPIGGLSMIIGGGLALLSNDLKRMLAYFTVSALGLMVMLLGIGSEEAIKAAMVFLLAHALYKGALFMLAGAVDHETGTRDLARLGGLRQVMPLTAIATVLAAISLAAVGPVLSYIAKEMILKSVLHASWAPLLTTLTVLTAATFVAGALIISIRPFFGHLKSTAGHEAHWTLWSGAMLLGILGWLLTFVPHLPGGKIAAPASSAVLGHSVSTHLELWHGLTPAFGFTILSALLGVGLFFIRGRARAYFQRNPWIWSVGPERGYHMTLCGIAHLAVTFASYLRKRHLPDHMLLMVVAGLTLTALPLMANFPWEWPASLRSVRFYEVGVAIVILAAALSSLTLVSRLAVLAALAVVGFGVALLFVFFSGPDLAMTQFLVETLLLVLLVVAFNRLPQFSSHASRGVQVRDGLIALAGGVLMTTLAWTASAAEASRATSEFFARHSLPEAHGRNIVNVILVDFRALDTLGEITVLATAAMGVFALLKIRGKPEVHR